ncbi:SRR1-like protein [Hypsizygus marmoreus]|uniref:SRR1-like protein n=1 Tax=Hypsizygus marmoreus TaxID=39966 RepID=A0A369JS49_HYPMA|nr:SRR1-like protein [Hypsizygus marmoreus]
MSGTSTDDFASFSYSDFKPANSRKKRRNRNTKDRPSFLAVIQRLREELGQGDWLTQCQQLLVESLGKAFLSSPDVLCLGLGSPTSSLNARVQLAFLLEICDHLNIDRARVSVYDPVFTDEDLSLFTELQVQILTENKNAEYPVLRPTICFMPHCDMELYENILKANWSSEQLSNLLFVANRLADYIDSNPTHKLQSRVPCILHLAPSLQCYPLPATTVWPTAFNNTSVQFIGLQSDFALEHVEFVET